MAGTLSRSFIPDQASDRCDEAFRIACLSPPTALGTVACPPHLRSPAPSADPPEPDCRLAAAGLNGPVPMAPDHWARRRVTQRSGHLARGWKLSPEEASARVSQQTAV